MDKALKTYLQNNFSFRDLKKAGFYSKEIKSTDYEKQAERICQKFGLTNVYDYSRIGVGTRFHISDGCRSSLTFTETIRDKFGDEILKAISA